VKQLLEPRILYPSKLSFNLSGEIRTFHDKDKLKQFKSTKPELQKILKGIFCTEEKKNNHKYERSGKNKTQKEN
jgi:hypothetical protein